MLDDESLSNWGERLEEGFEEGSQTAQNYLFDLNTEYGMETAQALESSTAEEAPGFGAVAGVLALAGATYLALRGENEDSRTYDDETEYDEDGKF